MRYDAFLSYSHALDGALAPALQNGLQRFARRWHEMRALAIFRDETDLGTSPHLWGTIEAALAGARYFVLLASPRAAASPWVNREVAWWLANRPPERLLIVLTEGRLGWAPGAGRPDSDALPPALIEALASEPRFLDLRWARSVATDLSLQHNRFRESVADLAATLHGRPKSELIGEEVRQYRRVKRLTRGAIAALALLTLAASGTALWALRQQSEAERQQAVAERNFGTALDAADAMVSQVAETLTDLQGVSKQRVAELLTNAEGLFTRLAETGGERRVLLDRQAGLLLAFARAYMELGDDKAALARARAAMDKLDRAAALPGEPDQSALDARRASGLFLLGQAQQAAGDTAAAEASYQEAHRIYADLVAQPPENAAWIAEFAEAHYYLAQMAFQQGDLAKAMEIGAAGMAQMRRAVALDPDNRRWLRDLAVGNASLATGYRLQGRKAEASVALEEARVALERLTAEDPSNLDLKQSLALTYQQMGGLALEGGDDAAAIDRLRAAVRLLADIAVRDPSNLANANAYGAISTDLAQALETVGDLPGAAAVQTEALAYAERVLRASPGNVTANQLAINASAGLARLSLDSDPAKARESFLAAIGTLLRLLDTAGESPALRFQLATLQAAAAQAEATLGNHLAAIQGFDLSVAALRALVDRDASNASYKITLLATYNKAGWSLRELQEAARARSAFERGLALAEAYARREPGEAEWIEWLMLNGNALRLLLAEQRLTADARAVETRLLAFLQMQRRDRPDDPVLARLEGELRLYMGRALQDAGDYTAALGYFRQAGDLASLAVLGAPDDAEGWKALAAAAEGQALLLQGEPAAKAFVTAVDALRTALRSQPYDTVLLRSLADDLNLLGWELLDQGDLSQAQETMLEAARHHEELASAAPNDAALHDWLSRDYFALARVAEAAGDLSLALQHAAAAAAAQADVVALVGDDTASWRLLANRHYEVARLNELVDDLNAAAVAYSQAAEIFQVLVAEQPGDQALRFEYGYLLRLQSNNEILRGQAATARRAMDRALALLPSTWGEGSAPELLEYAAVILADDARLRWDEGDSPGAQQGFRQSLQAAEDLGAFRPDDLNLGFFAVQTKRWLVEVLILSDQTAEAGPLADAALQQAVALRARGYDTAGEVEALERAKAFLAGNQ